MKAFCCFLLFCCAALSEPDITVQDRATALDQQLTSPVVADVNIARAKTQLHAILSRAEFRQLSAEPSALERWRRAFVHWLADHLGGLFKALAQHPTTSQIIFWMAAIGACGFLAFLLFRIFGDVRTSAWTSSKRTASPVTPTNDWVKQAFLASERGDLNRGIQCLYWAGVKWLQISGALPSAAGLTPRELARTARTTAAGNEINRLTWSLERFWYACVPATAEDFAACVRSLEALGCKVQ